MQRTRDEASALPIILMSAVTSLPPPPPLVTFLAKPFNLGLLLALIASNTSAT